MTPIEFLYRLRQLPDETPLSVTHMGAVFEMLSAALAYESGSATPLPTRLTDEAALSDWLRIPLMTIRSWRLMDAGGVVRYRLGSVRDWITDHIVEPSNENKHADIAAAAHAYWTSTIPALVIDDKLLGFFWSLEEETTPTDYTLLHVDTLALQPSRMPMDDLANITASLDAHGQFGAMVMNSPTQARDIYARWKDKAMPEVLLQFFRSALSHDMVLAKEIAETLDTDLLRKHFNIAGWLWEQLLQNDFCKFKRNVLLDVFDMADVYGVNLNQNAHVQDALQRDVFHGTVAHLLADTKGDTYRLRPIDACPTFYADLLVPLLKRSLNIDKKNANNLTGREIANSVEVRHGVGHSLFKKVVDAYELSNALHSSLSEKPTTRHQQRAVKP